MTNRLSRSCRVLQLGIAVAMVGVVFISDGWAASGGFEFTRATYDVIMRWVNFMIMVALFLKFARKPLMDFLRRQRSDVETSLEHLEAQKNEVEEKIKESEALLAASQERLLAIKERIEKEGRQRKEQLVDEARNESRLMLEAARAKADGQIREAVRGFKAELIDKATELAAARLPSLLKKDDHDNFVNQWLEAAQ